MSFENTTPPLLAPSILSADFWRLGEEVKSIEEGGADWVHVDVMDGHFVPNLTIGPLVVKALKAKTRLTMDCHLMVENPEKWIKPFAKAGADVITVHAEACTHLDQVIHQIRQEQCRVGVSLNPSTPLSCLEPVLDQVDLVLIMSVNPGFGGQKFIESSFSKIEQLKERRGTLPFLIEVDGGVTLTNITSLRQAGADVFVAGSAIFGSGNPKKATAEFRSILK